VVPLAQLEDAGDGSLAFVFDADVDPAVIADLRIVLAGDQCGGGGAYPQEHSGRIRVTANICRPGLPDGELEFQVVGALLCGPWTLAWTP
jgi:hypothetical protein